MRKQKQTILSVRVRWIWLCIVLLTITCVFAGNSVKWNSSAPGMELSASYRMTGALTKEQTCGAFIGTGRAYSPARTDIMGREPTNSAQMSDPTRAQYETGAETDPPPIPLGLFRLTVYTPYCDGGVWGYQTATGVSSQHLVTCAVDPDVIPLGSTIEIGGLTLKAVDTGSAVKGRVIDIFYDGPVEEAYRWLSTFGSAREATVILGEKTAT